MQTALAPTFFPFLSAAGSGPAVIAAGLALDERPCDQSISQLCDCAACQIHLLGKAARRHARHVMQQAQDHSFHHRDFSGGERLSKRSRDMVGRATKRVTKMSIQFAKHVSYGSLAGQKAHLRAL